jgi:hypothetical protein
MNEIDQYLRANRAAYTREALTERLVEEGHAREDVEAAWIRLEAADRNWSAGAAAASRPGGKPGIGTILLIIAVAIGYGYIGLLGFAGIGYIAFYPGSGTPGAVNVVASALLVVYVGAMLAGLLYSIRRLWRAPSLAGGGAAIGGAFGIAVLVLIGINGACIAGVLASSALGGLQ